MFGFVTGLMAGLLGISGGLILIPGLIYLLGMRSRQAILATGRRLDHITARHDLSRAAWQRRSQARLCPDVWRNNRSPSEFRVWNSIERTVDPQIDRLALADRRRDRAVSAGGIGDRRGAVTRLRRAFPQARVFVREHDKSLVTFGGLSASLLIKTEVTILFFGSSPSTRVMLT